MSGFQVVDDAERTPRGQSTGRPVGPLAAALLAGQTVFIPGRYTSGRFRTVSKQGKRICSRRRRVIDGVAGTVVWAEDK